MKLSPTVISFIKSVAIYTLLIIMYEYVFTHYFDLPNYKKNILEIFFAIMTYQIGEEVMRRIKKK